MVHVRIKKKRRSCWCPKQPWRRVIRRDVTPGARRSLSCRRWGCRQYQVSEIDTNKSIIRILEVRFRKHFHVSYLNIFSGSDQSFPPSFRMHRNYSFPVRGGSHNHSRKDKRRTRLLNQLKKSAGVIKSSLPKIKDVNVIDKYSRVVFPVSFILFNVAYWCFYVLDTDGE